MDSNRLQAHLWQGEWIDDEELAQRLPLLGETVQRTLAGTFPLQDFIAACDTLSHELAPNSPFTHEMQELAARSQRFSAADVDSMFDALPEYLGKKGLQHRLLRELGDEEPFTAQRVDVSSNNFTCWAPLGLLVHIIPSNAPAIGALAMVEGLLTGNFNLMKLSSSDTPASQKIIEKLCQLDAGGRIKDYLIMLRISSRDQELLGRLLAGADCVSAWGGEAAVQTIRRMSPTNCRFVQWGHKLSFGYVAASRIDDPVSLSELAGSCCLLEQQACSSPQTVFVETDSRTELEEFGKRLATAIENHSRTLPPPAPSRAEQAEITNVVQVARLEELLGATRVFEAEDRNSRVIVSHKSGLQPSPLYRTIWVSPICREKVIATLAPMRDFLQSAGLAADTAETAELCTLLTKAGVTRVSGLGNMLGGYPGAPHDGIQALAQFCKKVSYELDDRFASCSSLLEFAPPQHVDLSAPPLHKKEFQSQHVDMQFQELTFRSGGTSGKPAMSFFTYRDYHRQMLAAARGLRTAGLDPATDRCANLFASGDLYGGFLSFHTILEYLRAPQLPITLMGNLEHVARLLVDRRANTLISAPAYILELFRSNERLLQDYGGIQKIFFGGEHFTKEQRRYLTDTFGIDLIRSACYGSNDAGPIGYQCEHCRGTEHHAFHDILHLDIFDMEEDRPVTGEAPGRILITSFYREGQEIKRYEIGDLGRWVHDPCPCGRKAPKFELLGRFGDVFKAGGPFLSYDRFVRILGEQFDYAGWVQILLDDPGGKLRLTLRLEPSIDANSEKVATVLTENYDELRLCLDSALISRLDITLLPQADFDLVPSTGKLRHIIDLREL
jgi:phenylacetate-coenzyme A ligase PaaK-like adenylate-forming protein